MKKLRCAAILAIALGLPFNNLKPAQFDRWAIESLKLAQQNAYPKMLKRGQLPNGQYQANTFRIAEE